MAFTITNGLCSLADVKAAINITDTNDDDRLSLAIDAASRLIETKCHRRFWLDPAARVDATCTLNGTATVLDASIVAADVGRQVLDLTGHGYIQPDTIVWSVVPGVSFTLANFQGIPLPASGSGVQALTIGLVPRRFVSTNSWLADLYDDVATTTGLTVQTDYAGDGSFGTTWEVADYQLEPVNGLYGGELWPFTKIRAIRSLWFPVWGGSSLAPMYTQALIQVTAQWGWPSIPTAVNQAAIIQSIATFKATDVPFGATPFAETGILRLKQDLHPTAAMLLSPYREDPVLVG